jgi:hypothetical protein
MSLYLDDVVTIKGTNKVFVPEVIPDNVKEAGVQFVEGHTDNMYVHCNLGNFYMSDVMGNCGMVYLSHLHWRDNIAPVIDFGVSLAEDMGYTKVFYTLTEQQGTLEAALLSRGWKESREMSFTNKRTQNLIKVLSFTIENEGE